jgi:Leucine-rich repeat (LRR) protein
MWSIADFRLWVTDGRPINENIIKLNISSSNIKSFGNLENLVNLEELNCCNNELVSLDGIENLVNLKKLNCYDNKLVSLGNYMKKLVNLKIFICSYNELESLEGIENLVNLKILFCFNNQLTSLIDIVDLKELEILFCFDNKIKILELITNLTNFIKNKGKIPNHVKYGDFIDTYKFVELKIIFDNLLKCKNESVFIINEYIEKIEKMIIYFDNFQKFILK